MTKSASPLNFRYEATRDSERKCVATLADSYQYRDNYYERHNKKLHFHNALEMICIFEGEVEYVLTDGFHHALSGDVLIFEEMTPHEMLDSTMGLYSTILIPDHYLGTFRQLRGGRRLNGHVCHEGTTGVVLAAAHKLRGLNRQNPTGAQAEQYRQTLVDTMLLTIAWQLGFVEKPEQESDRILSMIAYMNDHLSENLTIIDIARKFGYSPRTLTGRFREYAGVELKQYLTELRLSSAKELIRGGATLEEAAERSGYGCLRSFHRAFLTGEGMTPGEYRETVMKKS